MGSNLDKIKKEFTDAATYWNLEKLYIDLASAKGKALTQVEKRLLRGLLCGYSPAEIANTVYQSNTSSTVRVYLSNGLYKYIENLLSSQTGNTVKLQNWSRVTHLLEKAGYKRNFNQSNELLEVANQIDNNVAASVNQQPKRVGEIISPLLTYDWGEAIDVNPFYGRVKELSQLEQWIVTERCRLVVLLGMGGIGKTALSIRSAEQIQDSFDYVIWRSLSHAPSVAVILAQLLQVLSPQQHIDLSENLNTKISQLISYLRSSRCLVILDHTDAIFRPCERPGQYREGYEGYGELIRRVGHSSHQSCLVLTSREKPKEIAALQGATLPVRVLSLTGLSNAAGWEIFKSKGLFTPSEEEWDLLIQWYGGNPLFIKIIATTIQDLFDGKISKFLEHNIMILGEIREILEGQFNRLTKLEKKILFCLTLNAKKNSLQKWQEEILFVSQAEILEAIEFLQKRSLIKGITNFYQDKVIFEYVLEKFNQQIFKDNTQEILSLIPNAMLQAKFKNYIRESL